MFGFVRSKVCIINPSIVKSSPKLNRCSKVIAKGEFFERFGSILNIRSYGIWYVWPVVEFLLLFLDPGKSLKATKYKSLQTLKRK